MAGQHELAAARSNVSSNFGFGRELQEWIGLLRRPTCATSSLRRPTPRSRSRSECVLAVEQDEPPRLVAASACGRRRFARALRGKSYTTPSRNSVVVLLTGSFFVADEDLRFDAKVFGGGSQIARSASSDRDDGNQHDGTAMRSTTSAMVPSNGVERAAYSDSCRRIRCEHGAR